MPNGRAGFERRTRAEMQQNIGNIVGAIMGLEQRAKERKATAAARRALLGSGADPGIVAAAPPQRAAELFQQRRIAELGTGRLSQDPQFQRGLALFRAATLPTTGGPALGTFRIGDKDLSADEARALALQMMFPALQLQRQIQPGAAPGAPGAAPAAPPATVTGRMPTAVPGERLGGAGRLGALTAPVIEPFLPRRGQPKKRQQKTAEEVGVLP